MVDSSAAVDSSLQNDVQALFKDMNCRQSSHRGLLRWTLEKKAEADPSYSDSLIQVLVKELEKSLRRMSKVDKTRFYAHVIPLLHTLYYVVIQSGASSPARLHQDVLGCLMRALTLPLPYSAVAKRTLRSIRMEMTTPGSLCLRRVTAEHNLTQEQFTQERVFVLADAAVFSAPLEAAARRFLESDAFRDPAEVQRVLVLRVLQKALGSTCQRSRTTQALQALGDRMVERCFQEVAAAVEQSLQSGAAGWDAYISRLEEIQRDLLTASKLDEPTGGDGCLLPAMPLPQISFHLWKEEKNLSKLLEKFALLSSSSVNKEENNKRDRDSGIVGDLKESKPEKPEPASKSGPAAWSDGATSSGSAGSPATEKTGVRKHLTARVVVMGDDRVLGRLARTFHAIRKKEAKRLTLTKKLNMEFYYVPVTAVEPWNRSPSSRSRDDAKLSLAAFLERVDPWYSYNISSLGAAVSALPLTKTPRDSSEEKLHLLDTLSYYLRCGTQPVNLPVYSVKMTRCSGGVTCVQEDVFVSHLEAEMPEFRHLKQKLESADRKSRRQTVAAFGGVITVSYTTTSLSKRHAAKGEAPMTCGVAITSEPAAATGEDFLSVRFDPQFNRKIQTRNISIKTMEHRTLSVCLDKDVRRTFTDVQRIEVSPCLDPRRSVLPLSKYLDKVLSLPINTFCGFSP